MRIDFIGGTIPPPALVLSIAALTVPVIGALQFPEQLGDYGALLWLTALLPVFMLAYYGAWRGIATALAAGIATLSVTQAAVLLAGRQVPDMLLGVVISYVAISLCVGWLAESLHQERAVVEDMAFTDLLTELPNRRNAHLFLENTFAAAERGQRLSLVLFDLDDFKKFNDRFGHAAGDVALREFGDILERTTRRMDLSARFGGEEFLSILTSTDTEGALIFGDRIRAVLSETDLRHGDRLTVSAGVATYDRSMRSPDELLAAADHALYEAKNAGRNCLRLFGHGMTGSVLAAHDAPEELLERVGEEPEDCARAGADVGKSRPPLTLLPHQITGFGKGRRVLVVEDDYQVRSLVSNYLKSEGFEVHQGVDVPTGIHALSKEYDVIITDLRLPATHGTELIAAAKSRWPMTQILVITSPHDPRVAAEALSAGADRYLFKPFGMLEMRSHLIDSLNRRDRIAERNAKSAELSEDALGRQTAVRKAVLEGTASLIRAVEARDPFTAQHAARVAEFAMRVATKLDPDESLIDREGLMLGCRLHDIGNLGLSDRVLNKKDHHEPHERESVERHPSTGRALLRPLLDDEVALAVVGWHHERWDGKGYPDGLAGAAIPLAPRLVAVCDALDAMTSDRAHRPAIGCADAIAKIGDMSGTWYDPDVVTAVRACAEDLHAIFMKSHSDTGPE